MHYVYPRNMRNSVSRLNDSGTTNVQQNMFCLACLSTIRLWVNAMSIKSKIILASKSLRLIPILTNELLQLIYLFICYYRSFFKVEKSQFFCVVFFVSIDDWFHSQMILLDVLQFSFFFLLGHSIARGVWLGAYARSKTGLSHQFSTNTDALLDRKCEF